MNVLVTGHTGFLGNAIVGGIKEKGDFIVGIERDENKRRDLRNHPDAFVKGDIRDYDFIRRVIVDYEVEEIYHCAAQAIVRSCANDPYTTYDINVMGTVSMLEACRNSGETVKSIVVSTSDKAFGHAPIPYTEATPLNPLYTYETSKACQQLITLSYFHNYGVPAKVLASSNVYGPGDPNLSRIIPNTIIKLFRDEPALLFEGAADYIREFVYITDVVDAFITASRKGKNGEVYCCGGTEHLTIRDMLRKICSLMGKDSEKDIKTFQKSRYFKEIEQQYIDSTKLKSLGWSPKVKLEDGLKKSIEYYTEIADSKGY
jgi:nucleoside-diphosphate-sugar epimerase